jgi:membrane protein implicated in regulation of membrane protease activity
MEIMNDLKDILAGGYKMYFAFAVFGSCILFFQLLLMFLGFSGSDHDFDCDSDGHLDLGEHSDTGLSDFKLFSFRTIIAFITFFGWGGVSAWHSGMRDTQCFLVALVCGGLMMVCTALLIFFMLKMQHNGNIESKELIGCKGTVYLRIPGGDDIGKVTVEVKGTTQEVTAVSDTEIMRGETVEVIEEMSARKFKVVKV